MLSIENPHVWWSRLQGHLMERHFQFYWERLGNGLQEALECYSFARHSNRVLFCSIATLIIWIGYHDWLSRDRIFRHGIYHT